MPSAEHETPIALLKLDPSVAVWLLANVFDVKVPDYHHARAEATDARVLVPRTFHADGIYVFRDPADKPQIAVVFEVQREWDIRKRRTWKLYTAQRSRDRGRLPRAGGGAAIARPDRGARVL